jgi:hypothetical protein
MADFYKIRHKNHAIGDELDAILYNPIASIVSKLRTFELLRWRQNLHQSRCNYEELTTPL